VAGAAEDGGAACEVHDDCWETVKVFLAMETQWRLDQGYPIGMDYAALPVVCRGLRCRFTPDLFDDLQLMEGEALAALAERRAKR
jgi:hypothetical protein